MIRKTFLCVAGILAGASTGAYFDGFFEQENVVTNAYNQLVSKFNSTDALVASDTESAMITTTLNGEETSSVGSSTASPVSPMNPTASRSSSKNGAQDKASRKKLTDQQDNASSSDADEETQREGGGSTKKATSEPMASSKKDKSVKPTDLSKEETKGESSRALSESQSEKENIANKKLKALEDAKSLALLDVRFSKETYKSPSGGELKYRKLKPRTVGNKQRQPLIVFLHGRGERGDDNVTQLKHGLDYLASQEGMKKYPATIIVPQCPDDIRWSTTLAERPGEGNLDPTPTEALRMTLELIDSIQITDNVDPDRIYVTGLSMGGFGTFDIIARRPSIFAAAVPLCGGGDTRLEIVQRFKKTPLWIIHGDEDSVVDVDYSRSMVAALQDVGASPRYSELKGFGHNIWDAAYADAELYKWLFSQSKAGERKASTSDQQPVISKPVSPKPSVASVQPSSDKRTSERSTASSTSLKGAIQSEWQVLAATQRGRRADEATLKKMRVNFKGEAMTIAIGDRREAATYKLPTIKNSHYPWIDIISQREGVEASAGILAMQGDKLVICWGMPGASRPTSFESRESVKTLVLQKK